MNEIIHQDFTNYVTIKQHLQNIDICFFCIGVYTSAVTKEEFNIITIDMPFELGKALKIENPNITFSLLSGIGADSTEKSKTLFAKAKGISENKLINLNFKKLTIFRPGYIYPVTPRKEPNMSYQIFRLLHRPLAILMTKSVTTSVQLANKMMNVALTNNNQLIFENKEIIKND